MRPRDDTHLREAWISLYYLANGSPERGRLFWAWERVNKLATDEPEEALAFVRAVLAHDRSDRVVENLAAGPLEDLLARHPYRMIEAVEAEARANPHFAHLLGGVWQNEMPDDVWRRVQAAATARW